MKLRGILALALMLVCAPAFAQVTPGTSPLSGAKGGTNNAFMQFTGPATSLKTYTLPNSSANLAALNIIQTWTSVQTFTDTTLVLAGASSGTTTLKAPATGGGTATLFPGTDTIAGIAATQALTNKTFNCASNTCTVRIGSDVSGLGTGVATALANNTETLGAFVVVGGGLGTPSSGVATNLTGTAAGLTAGNATTNANLTGPVTSVGNATTIGINQVARNNEAQGLARSVIGNATNAAANVADIQGTANQALVVNNAGTALAFGQVNLASSAAVIGTLPLANGGTGDTGTAWTPYTPTVVCSGGSGTWSALGRSKTLGKTVYVSIAVTLSAIGTCTPSNPQVTFTLPFTAQSPLTMLVRNTGTNPGIAYQGYGVASSATITLASMAGGNVALTTGDLYIGSAVYESQ